MKNRIFSILTLLFVFAYSSNVSAQIDATINPLGLLAGGLNVGADFVINEKFSVEGQVGILAKSKNDYKYFGIPINVVGKYYLNPEMGADKFYIDVFLRFVSRKTTYSGASSSLSDYSQTRFGIGFGLGYKIVTDKSFVFDIGIGAGRAITDNTKFTTDVTGQSAIEWPKIMFLGKLGIGYRFGGDKK